MPLYSTIPPLTTEDRELLAIYAPPPPRLELGTACCEAFVRGVYTASIGDPQVCTRCAALRRAAEQAARYAWRPAPFGRIRIVPSWEAQAWERGL
jgi:hypothetical protein